ncbi:PREDICTED: protein lin-37 homolog [Nicrophorus vespilloides]|uniref:Protein lin-37 homolog n=1 Tax=Nicrophorus vespilloides TaxID=110193 RepID=A0ABM1N0P1_NICVS|nr:PREDICTED: protein lin-37 homolog [Nicrophorus vespilloides]
MEDSAKRRKTDSSPTMIKVEVKEENTLGNDYLMAKGRLQGVLKQLTEQSESESEDSEEENRSYKHRKHQELARKKADVAVRSTYLMKLYDRSVDLARFEEDTPLYPICRAWIANNNKKTQTVIKRRLSSPEPQASWSASGDSDTYHLPPPSKPFVSRVPSPIPEQMVKTEPVDKSNSEEKPVILKHQLLKEHLQRWNKIKKKWFLTAAKNEERYAMSKHILQSIYSRAQESIMGE